MDQINRNDDVKQLKVFIADVAPKNVESDVLKDRMDELENLVETYWGFVIEKRIQKRDNPDLRTYIGKWKLEEVVEEMVKTESDLLIIGNVLKPGQLFKINEALREKSEELWLKEKMKAWDRIDLILKIFGKHAEWMEARLQIELASIKHMWPRIFDMGMELGKQGAWTGSKGSGESNTEIMKRHLKRRQSEIQKKLKEFERMRLLHRESRIKKWLKTVGIVGYTNAGKSSLLNSLTKKWVLAENKLFATLGTNVGKMFVWTDMQNWIWQEILLSDTIWFIRDLPPKLIDAFSSTLEDSIESDILLHVVDSSDEFIQERINTVNEILEDIWANQKQVMVFNKIDKLSEEKLSEMKGKYDWKDNIWISVNEDLNIEELREKIISELFGS